MIELDMTTLLEAQLQADEPLPAVVAVVVEEAGISASGAAGARRVGEPGPISLDSVLAIQSASKPIVATAALQLAESGALDLDAPASRILSSLAAVRVLDGFEPTGAPRLRPPRREITARMLLLHTSGFGYDLFDEDLHRLATSGHLVSPGLAVRASLDAPLVADPGERWQYGLGIDWLGQLIETIEGARLDEVVRGRVLEPLGMRDTGFDATSSMSERFASVHRRTSDGGLYPTGILRPKTREVDMGGQGMYSTALDYARFLRAWLNDGEGDHGRILQRGTVRAAVLDGLQGISMRPLPSTDASLARPIDFLFPETRSTWATSFHMTLERGTTGRAPGTLSWLGLANTYFWIDRASGVAGFWACNLLPLGDPAARAAYLDFERAVYVALGHHSSRR